MIKYMVIVFIVSNEDKTWLTSSIEQPFIIGTIAVAGLLQFKQMKRYFHMTHASVINFKSTINRVQISNTLLHEDSLHPNSSHHMVQSSESDKVDPLPQRHNGNPPSHTRLEP